jgi:hypothetical protein
MIFDVRLGPTANIAVSTSATLKVTTTGGRLTSLSSVVWHLPRHGKRHAG